MKSILSEAAAAASGITTRDSNTRQGNYLSSAKL
jgi:hypothetical protein